MIPQNSPLRKLKHPISYYLPALQKIATLRNLNLSKLNDLEQAVRLYKLTVKPKNNVAHLRDIRKIPVNKVCEILHTIREQNKLDANSWEDRAYSLLILKDSINWN